MDVLAEVMGRFAELAQVPRCSGNEEPIRRWIEGWARDRGLSSSRDGSGNIRIDVPASQGREEEPPLVIQAHQDMVCETRSGHNHDFSENGVFIEQDGDWLVARDTTLGADDGAGIALMLGVYDAGLPSHPCIELLFTASEESTMSGASGLSPGFLRGRTLLNLDSEQEGSLTVGCAGMRGIEITLPIERHSRRADTNIVGATLKLSGLHGGHSAVDIHRGQANANAILARFVKFARSRLDLRVTTWKAGNAPNMIARDGEVSVHLPPEQLQTLGDLCSAASERFRSEYDRTDPELAITCADTQASGPPAVTTATMLRGCELIMALPHGVLKIFDPPSMGLVSASINLAHTELADHEMRLGLTLRAATKEDAEEALKQVEAVALLAGAKFAATTGIEPWRGKSPSQARARARYAYKKAFRSALREEIAHGVLECGVIADRIPDMDMVSVGPTINGAHSPGERLHIPSLQRVARFLAEFVHAPAGAK